MTAAATAVTQPPTKTSVQGTPAGEDVFVNLIEGVRANGSLGNGCAQCA